MAPETASGSRVTRRTTTPSGGIDVLKNSISQHVRLPGPLFAGPYVGEGFVWAASASRIWKIRPSDGRIVATIPFDFPYVPLNNAPAAGEGALWIADPTQLQARPGFHFGVVAQIDPRTNHIERIPVNRPNGVAVGGGSVWARSGTDVDNPGTGSVTEINPSTNRVVRTIPLQRTDWVTAGDLGVLVSDGSTDILINPATGKVINHIVLPRGFGFLGEWDGSFWLDQLESH